MSKLRIVIIVFLISFIGFAQQKKYVSYTVQKGETYKSIAKQYNLSKRDLKRLNPDVGRKLKPNTVIIVPNLNFGKPDFDKFENIIHLVKPKETLFGISKKYGITIKNLKKANPVLEEGLKIGMKLTIPKPEKSVLDSSKYQLHTVVKDDTVYSLIKWYNISVEKLLKLNPDLAQGLKLGMVLKIKLLVEDSELMDSSGGIEPQQKFVENIHFGKKLNVAVMLPYQLNKMKDSVAVMNFEKSNSLLNITTDFHLGIQMAIDSVKSKGVNVRVNYYDTENSFEKIQYLVHRNNFDEVDVVVGPLFYDKAVFLSKKIKTPIIAPIFSKKQANNGAKNIVKSATDTDVLDDKLMDYLKNNYKGENIVVVNDDKNRTQSKLWKIVNQLKSFDTIQNITVIKPLPSEDEIQNLVINNEILIEKLSLTSNNWILLISDENETTASAINGLKSYESEEFDVRLFAFNKGKNFDKIDNNLLGSYNFTFPTSEYLVVDNDLSKRFYEKFQNINHAVPSKYAIRGFDVTYDVLARMASAETIGEGLAAGVSTRLSSIFNYNKKLFGATENDAVVVIQYTKDLESIIFE